MKEPIVLFSDQELPHDIVKPMIFLAGPTSRTNVYEKSWRKTAVDVFRECGFDGYVCVPEFYYQRQFTDDDWDRQTDWEWNLLSRSDCIMFWVPRNMKDMPGLTTNLEFGTYLSSNPGKIILGYPDDAVSMQWMEKRYRMVTNRASYDNMRAAICASIEVANTNYQERTK